MKAKIFEGKYGTVVKVKFELEFSVEPDAELSKEDVLDMINDQDRTDLGELILNNLSDANVILEEPIKIDSGGSIDISQIMKDNNKERSFIKWLNENKIRWSQKGSNLNIIYLSNRDIDFLKIVEVWPEVEKLK